MKSAAFVIPINDLFSEGDGAIVLNGVSVFALVSLDELELARI
jgi:hypothetical protein